jgi:hypothetical protein
MSNHKLLNDHIAICRDSAYSGSGTVRDESENDGGNIPFPKGRGPNRIPEDESELARVCGEGGIYATPVNQE